jgi:TPR repeat protein
MYQKGKGVSQDDAEAAKWFREAAEQGDKDGQNWLGWMCEAGKGVPQNDVEAVKWYRKAAEQGLADAQKNLGVMYQKGKGVPQDDAEAVKWYREAAEQGNADAQKNLGAMYEKGKGIPQDDAQTVKRYREAAEQGNADAQNNLGVMYQKGKGVPQDDAEAAKWYRKAAEQGYVESECRLGFMYRYGKGVPQNDAEAVTWYRKAADKGNAYAQYNLGAMYEKGKGVPHDDVEAVKWYRKAAEQGYAQSECRLGWMYLKGKGVPHDDVESLKWYFKAAEQGNADAEFWLGWMYHHGKGGVSRDTAEAQKWYRRAAEQGESRAQYWLGWMYHNGKGGVSRDTAEAQKWYRRAAEQRESRAQFWLGWMYEKGEGVPQDDAEAVKWYRRAAGQGEPRAQFRLGCMCEEGEGVLQDDVEAVKWYREAAEQGDSDAQFRLGLMYRRGRGVPQNDAEAVKWFREAAERLDMDGQNWLGWMYERGEGVPQDDAEAVKWYRKAAEQGNADAQKNLGAMYEKGKGVPQDDAEALKWYRKAVEQGNADAQFRLGLMYQKGKGVPQDDVEAVKWFRQAAEQGDTDGQNWLGWMYQKGKGVPQNNSEAVKWFQKAAEQGNGDAQKNLEQMKAEGITRLGSKNKKSSAVDRHLRDAEECKALLDACTPHLYIKNAFRISGIAIDALTRDIKRRIDDLKSAAEMGDLKNELIHAFALNPTPSLDQIREAAQRLQEPEQRIIDEFFWFWPYELGKSVIDPALRSLRECDYGSAFKIWSEALSDIHTPRSTVAKHNLAVMYHIKALDAEQNALKNDLSAEQLFMISKDWRTCFKWWEELADNETLWSLVTDRIRMVDDPRLTTGFARRMRATLSEGFGKINAMLAKDFAERGKFSHATDHIDFMKETRQGKDSICKTLSFITKPHKARVSSAVEKAVSIAKQKPSHAAEEALELLQAISEPLRVIQAILPPEDLELIDLCDTVAEACLTCQITYARESEDWSTSLEILDAASKYAASQETRDRLANNRSNVEANKHVGALTKKIEEIELNLSTADKMSDIKNDLIPHLSNIKKLPGMTDSVYEKCADAVARYIRGLSISEYNENDNSIGALRILEISISIACGWELCEQLKEDKTKLLNIQKETTKHNLQMQIRSDEIEVTREFVRYKDQYINVSSIEGIKYGVFIQVTNGIRNASYLIDITDGQSGRIKVECKRFFRSEAQAEQDFDNILTALYHQVIPSLVQKFAEGVVSGRHLQIGNCRLTIEGVYITTGVLVWKKETLVPFSDLRFSKSAGQVNVSSVKQSWIGASMAIRDIWNATLLEYIVKAIVEMKAKR